MTSDDGRPRRLDDHPCLPGEWREGPAPDGMRCWSLANADPSVHIVLDPGETLDAVDTGHAVDVLGRLPGFIAEAERAIAAAIAADPTRFGTTDPQAVPMLDHPEITLWTNRRWMIRFATCALPTASELGVGVDVDGTAITSVTPLDDAETID